MQKIRRTDRAVTSDERIDDIISSCRICRLALTTDGAPYIVPMNFGFERIGDGRVFYFHCASAGRKLDLISRSPNVGFEADCAYELRGEGDTACDYTALYRSVIGTGRIDIISDRDEKLHALSVLMDHAAEHCEWKFNERHLAAVCVLRLTVDEISAKEHLD